MARKDPLMKEDSLLGVWTGAIRDRDGWEMKMTLSILQPVAVGAMLGVFDIPLLPCSGTLRVIAVRGEVLDLRAEKLQGECLKPELQTLELLPDGALRYTSKGEGWLSEGVLRHVLQQ
jgi:hypothetical protein